jgi:hypothetical protein
VLTGDLPFCGAGLSFSSQRGCSSVVERNLAKVDVDGSNPFSRSNQAPAQESRDFGRVFFLGPVG